MMKLIRRSAYLLAVALLFQVIPAKADTRVVHGTSLLGDLKYSPDFKHFDYVNPDALKGGDVRLSAVGSFDSLHPFILKGRSAAGLGLAFESLMAPANDEASTYYGLIAESVEIPDDFSWVAYTLRPEARWHDGSPITTDDVIFSFEMLKTKGHPFYRAYYANVASAEQTGPHTVKFTFAGGLNRELPQIVGQLPVLPKAVFEGRDFEETTLEPIMASGPYRVMEVDPGRAIIYERIKDYWGADLPVNRGRYNFDRIRYDYYRDQTVALEAFKSKEYDFRQETAAKVWATGYDVPSVRDGLIITEEIRHEVPTGMQAFVFNIRRYLFQDRRVREALSLAFDFEWANKNLFYGQYARTGSFFSNSELAATGLPSNAELDYLQPFRGQIPDEVFNKVFETPATDGTGNIRGNLRKAQRLLKSAGWTVQNGALTNNTTGQAMEFEVLLVQPTFERVVLPFAQNLKKLGIEVRVRTVDTAQFQNRIDEFDFDVSVQSFGQSLSPGNEQRDWWGSANADIPGSRNVIGIKNPAIDSLINSIIEAPDRQSLIAATRAMDRVLLWNHYVIPQWHSRVFRVAFWNRFSRPEITPKYGLGLFTWWIDPEKDAALKQRAAEPAK
jgi:microcin C transport system substrate-binding protein